MKNQMRKIAPLTALAVILLSLAPMVSASTLTVSLNPKSGLAKVVTMSSTDLVFTYPSNSTVSSFLRNVTSSLSLKGSFDGSAQGTQVLQGSFDDEDSHVVVKNMTVAFGYTAKGSTTQLVIHKSTNISAWVSGMFSVVNGSVTANMGWRAFVIRGAMSLPLENHMVDVNLAGSTMGESFGEHAFVAGFLQMGAWGWWNRPTLNYSQLNTPLSTWTKDYNAATNTTTYSKTITGSSSFSASLTYNNQKYTLTSTSDPTGVVTVQGYANAVGDSLVIAPAPVATSSGSVLAVTGVIAVLALAVGYIAIRARSKPRTTVVNTTSPV
jgi:hypothetical protein